MTDKCKGCNNVKGCITCVDGSCWAHYEETISEDSEEAVPQGTQLEIKFNLSEI